MSPKFLAQVYDVLNKKRIVFESDNYTNESIKEIGSIEELTQLTRQDKSFFESMIKEFADKIYNEQRRRFPTARPHKPDLLITYNEQEKIITIKVSCNVNIVDSSSMAYVITKVLKVNEDGTVTSEHQSETKGFVSK